MDEKNLQEEKEVLDKDFFLECMRTVIHSHFSTTMIVMMAIVFSIILYGFFSCCHFLRSTP